MSTVTRPKTGFYCISFSQLVSQPRLESAVVGLAGDNANGRHFPRAANGQGVTCEAGQLEIEVTDASGTPVNVRFSFVVS